MAIHVAITRRVRPGCEAEFVEAIREFLSASFAQDGVLGAGIISPAPGQNPHEYGILRTFAGEAERDAFYESAAYKAWRERSKAWTDGEPVHHQLHGLEAWFRHPQQAPPKWKMACATLMGVYPVSLLLGVTLGPLIAGWPMPLTSLAFGAGMVALLTWVVMPPVVRLLYSWLHSPE
ncbi:MAG TPA: antibiotic biosynthesis monooxygenase [Verrucomicrobiales bacterium]|nr:antibiotic biosynthesis monooxygenase [Verrucomicrobiales bacterium]